MIGDCLLKDKAGLRPRSVEGIDEKADTIDPVPDSFDFAGEIGMAGSVDDVDFIAVVVDGGCLCENRDATFMLDRVIIPGPDHDLFVFTESSAGL